MSEVKVYDDTTREFCGRCHKVSPVGFTSPDDTWLRVAGQQWEHDILCIMCFAQLGDEKHIRWEGGIELWPVSYATHHAYREDSGMIDALEHQVEVKSKIDAERERDRYREALEAISDKKTPCTKCGNPHERRVKPNRSFTWADPDDGHYYTPMDPSVFARRALEGDDDG